MLIKLTNATKGREGHAIIINPDHITSFFQHVQEDGTNVTVAFSASSQNSWEIAETIDEIMDKLAEQS